MLRHATIPKAVFIFSFVMLVSPSLAQQTAGEPSQPEPNFIAADGHPWSAVGKLNNGLFGACSAVLISEDYALTAAHCMYFRLLRRFLSAESFHLVLGYDNQSLGEHRHVAAYYIPPSYDPRKPFESIASDWALLQVAGDSQTNAKPIPVASEVNLTGQTEVMAAGYTKRRPHKMSADTACRIVGSSSDEKILFDTCNTPDGFSGGPILARNSDGRSFRIIGLHVANQAWQGKSVAIAISAAAIWPEIRACVEDQKCRFQHVARARDPTAAEILAGLPNLGLRKVIDMVADQICPGDSPQCGLSYAGPHGLNGQSPVKPGRRDPAPAAGQ